MCKKNNVFEIECPGIDITNGYAVDISADGTVLSAKCKNGFTSNATKSTCKNGIWSPPLINCSRGELFETIIIGELSIKSTPAKVYAVLPISVIYLIYVCSMK